MNGIMLAWIALLIIGASCTMWFRSMAAVRIPENRTPFVAAWLAGTLLGIGALMSGDGFLASVPGTLAVIGGVFFLFTVAISAQRVANDVISVGATLPEFTAPDENGETFSSASLAGKLALIKFFRGHW